MCVGALQATRALMVISILLTVIGLGVASMGMKCTNCGGDDKVKKSRIAMTGGIILLLGGESLSPFHTNHLESALYAIRLLWFISYL